jgi:hypothetical protein
MNMDIPGWIALGLWAVLPIAFLAARKWTIASIEQSIHHRFNEKIETLKSDLRAKESAISALQQAVLSGSFSRQALLDKRRLEAVERVWTTIIELQPYKNISAMMTSVKFEEIAKEVAHNPNIRGSFKVLLAHVPQNKPPPHCAHEQPFISPVAWAYYAAYYLTIASAYGCARFLKLEPEEQPGEEPSKYFTMDDVRNLLKVVLPHQSEYIEQNTFAHITFSSTNSNEICWMN